MTTTRACVFIRNPSKPGIAIDGTLVRRFQQA
jgi:hypothetical protein